MKTPEQHALRSQIIALTKRRAALTSNSQAKEWISVDRQISELQRKMNRLDRYHRKGQRA